MANYIDPEFLAFVAARPQLNPETPVPEPKTALDVRKNFNSAVGASAINFPLSEHIIETKHFFNSYDGAEITIHEFKRDDWPEAKEPTPALLHFHGGGIVACPIDGVVHPMVANTASEMGVPTFGVEYRLAPEHPYPTPVEDCYAALRWLVDNAARLNVDPKRISLFGESGGGTLVASVALVARDRGHSPPVAMQMMAYPMLDDRSQERHINTELPIDKANEGFRLQCNICWDAYLGEGKRGGDDVSVYAAPARATNLTGLPRAYIDVGTFDTMANESLEYATRLLKAGVEVDLHLYRGAPHGFDFVAPVMAASLNAKENRKRALRSM